MAAPVIDDLLLPINTVLVLPDAVDATTGVVTKRSSEGGGHFRTVANGNSGPIQEYSHILYVKEMSTEVNIESVEYLVMHESAVVGLIPD